MLKSIFGTRGIAVAPHALAAQSAIDVLRDGGNAVEGMIAAAATIAVVYPHMNSIGGDGFWLIHVPGRSPMVIEGCGVAAQAATREWYRSRGIEHAIPHRGGLAANTVAGAVSGWGAAYQLSRRTMRGRLPMRRLLADAIHYASRGTAVTMSQVLSTTQKQAELAEQPGYADFFLVDGAPPATGAEFRQRRLASTLRRLADAGTDDFYRGDLARSIARDLARAGSPIGLRDLEGHRAVLRDPLTLAHRAGALYNTPPPTQGLVSLLILGILDELEVGKVGPVTAEYIHLCVEAAKRAFQVRDLYITDPRYMTRQPKQLLSRALIRELAGNIDRKHAASWKQPSMPGDTVWLGVMDKAGRAVSYIQSIHHEFGSGVVLKGTGITWQNRGCSFSLDPHALNVLKPGRKPFHTLSPALAQLKDGRVMAYGAMGGDGQPQTQSALFTRIVNYGMNPQAAVSEPRWLFGRTWGRDSVTLKLESRFDLGIVRELTEWGHEMEVLEPFDETVGHAGALVRHPNGVMEGGADPRSDGAVAAF
ncbi:MAG TPA: gamma-glutamyltransferase family protein [Burkholderiales bacterium]